MKRLLLILFLGIPQQSIAQSPSRKEVDIQQILDELLSNQEEDVNYEDLYENYLQLLSQPLDLNIATPEQLRSLFLLSEIQLKEFVNYRAENGALLSEYELQSLPSFDENTIQRLLPFIKITKPQSLINRDLRKRILQSENSYLLTRYEQVLEIKKGFKETDEAKRFLGQYGKYYSRFRSSQPNDFSIGFTLEQDAGEPIHWNSSAHYYGIDFQSFHLQLQNKGKVKNLLIGDYQLQAGQGLVCGGAFGMGKGGETINTLHKSNLLALPFTSVAENLNLRGVTATYLLAPRVSITPYFSRTYRDANLNTDTLDTSIASSLLTTGLHRNAAELADRKQLGETLFGSIVRYQTTSFDVGCIHQSVRFDKALVRNPSLYNQFSFSRKSNSNFSIYTNYSIHNFLLFAELAKSAQGGIGLVAGTLGSLSNTVDLALSIRNYERNFYSFYANGFAESSAAQNERGIYWGLKYKLTRQVQFSGYLDLFEFPWLRYRSFSPSTGYEWLLRLQYQPSRTVMLSAQFREESKQRNISNESNFYLTDEGIKKSFFTTADYSFNRILNMKTRLQFSGYEINHKQTKGMLALQDITVTLHNLKISGRYALFDTDDYDNRFYVAEKEVWLAYSVPAVSGIGVRNYVLLQYDVSRRFTLWLRYAHLRLQRIESVGSGVDEIAGNEKHEVKIQLRIKL